MNTCGTPSGYVAHHRRGEPPCGPCREAQRAYRRAHRARRKENADPLPAGRKPTFTGTVAETLAKHPRLHDLGWFGVRTSNGFQESA